MCMCCLAFIFIFQRCPRVCRLSSPQAPTLQKVAPCCLAALFPSVCLSVCLSFVRSFSFFLSFLFLSFSLFFLLRLLHHHQSSHQHSLNSRNDLALSGLVPQSATLSVSCTRSTMMCQRLGSTTLSPKDVRANSVTLDEGPCSRRVTPKCDAQWEACPCLEMLCCSCSRGQSWHWNEQQRSAPTRQTLAPPRLLGKHHTRCYDDRVDPQHKNSMNS